MQAYIGLIIYIYIDHPQHDLIIHYYICRYLHQIFFRFYTNV